jgi:hypothetical protein
MTRALGLLVLLSLPLGCASTASLGTPEARRIPPTISPAPGSAPVPSVPSASPPPPSLQVAPRIDNEESAVRDVNARLARAGQVVAQVDASRLGNQQQEMLSGLKDFISKASDALQAHDIPRAQVLADKASRLADDLAAALRNPKATR